MIFNDPPRHTKLRALVSQAFTPRSIASLETRIRDLSRELLNAPIKKGQMDLATDFAIPLPLIVIAEMIGIPAEDRPRFRLWNDVLLRMSYTVVGPPVPEIVNEFIATTKDMHTYLTGF